MMTSSTITPSQRWLSLLLFLSVAVAQFSSSHALLLRPVLAHETCPSVSTRAPTASSCPTTATSTVLHHASDAGAMSQVDPSSKSGGCPFLDKSYDHKTYSVPAIFNQDDSRPIVLFDGDCNLCNKFVQTLLKYDDCSEDERGNLRFAALQSKVGGLLLKRMSEDVRNQVLRNENEENEEKYKSIVIIGPEKTYINSAAALKILSSLGGKSKRLKVIRFLSKVGYVVPTKLRDGIYKFVSRRRKKWFGASDECLLWDDRFDTRFVDDGVLTGVYRDPFADPKAQAAPPPTPNLFEGENPPVRGDKVRIIWPPQSNQDPSVTYDLEFPDGLCLLGCTGTITTIDLPMRVVMRVDRKSLGLDADANGDETMIAWVKPSEVAAMD